MTDPGDVAGLPAHMDEDTVLRLLATGEIEVLGLPSDPAGQGHRGEL